MTGLEVKICRTCGETKPSSEFYRNNKSKDGLRPDCKPCNRDRVRAWQEAERERMGDEAWRAYIAENTRRHYRNHPESVARNRAMNKARHTALSRLKAAHPDEYDALYAAELEREGVTR